MPIAFAAVLVAVVGAQSPAAAQPAPGSSPSDTSPYVIERAATQVVVQEDGGSEIVHQMRVRVADSTALELWGNLMFAFQADRESVTVRRLTIHKPDSREVVASNAPAEDITRSGTFEAPVYSDVRVRHITVPSLEVGDVLDYEIVVTRSTPVVEGHFWFEHRFTRDGVVQNEVVDIDVPAGRRFIVKVLPGQEITAESVPPVKGRTRWRWRHRQARPLELDDAATRKLALDAWRGRAVPSADVQVSSFESWDAIATWYSGLVAPRTAQDDAVRAKARELVEGRTDARSRLDVLRRFVAQEIRYVSLAFGEGRYEPRPAPLVLETRYGDCKDKHVLLAALAAAVGIEVRPVLVSTISQLDRDVPSPAQFDHVISVADPGEGKGLFWIDTTDEFAASGVLGPQLRAKDGVLAIAAGTTDRIVRTPAELPFAQHHRVEADGTLAPSGRLQLRVRTTLRGDIEPLARAETAAMSEEDLKKGAAAELSSEFGLKNASIVSIARGDAHATDVPFWIEYQAEHTMSSRSFAQRWNFWLPARRLRLPEANGGATAPLDLGGIVVREVRVRIQLPEGWVARPPVAITLDRPFARYASTYDVTGGTATLHRTLEIRERVVESGQLAEYASFLRAIEADYKQAFAIAPVPLSLIEPGTDVDSLMAAGMVRFDRREYAEAVALLRKAVAADPKHRSAWNNLGRALAAAGDHAGAIEAFRTQIDLNAFDDNAYNNLGYSLETLGRLDEAEQAYRQQIDVSPLDPWTHRRLGLLLARRERFADAARSLETAATITPDDPSLHVQLGRVRLETGKRTEALASFEAAIAVRADPPIWNDIAYYLAVHGLELERAHKYATQAVDRALEALQRADLADVRPEPIAALASLSMYWDTLGWVEYKRGNFAPARRYVEAAWTLSQHAEVAGHLAEILEREGDTQKAALIRRMASAAAGATAGMKEQSVRELADVSLSRARGEDLLVQARTVHVQPDGPGMRGTAEFFVLANHSGAVADARYIAGDESLKGAERLLRATRVPHAAPDDRPFVTIRRGVLTCPGASKECSFILYTASDAARQSGDGNRGGRPPDSNGRH